MENQTIFITGITGQDGTFLASKLINEKNNLKIYGTTRSKDDKGFFSKLDVIECNINISSKIFSHAAQKGTQVLPNVKNTIAVASGKGGVGTVSYTHLRAHETLRYLVCRVGL
mgnify:CR=1 FL=1